MRYLGIFAGQAYQSHNFPYHCTNLHPFLFLRPGWLAATHHNSSMCSAVADNVINPSCASSANQRPTITITQMSLEQADKWIYRIYRIYRRCKPIQLTSIVDRPEQDRYELVPIRRLQHHALEGYCTISYQSTHIMYCISHMSCPYHTSHALKPASPASPASPPAVSYITYPPSHVQ